MCEARCSQRGILDGRPVVIGLKAVARCRHLVVSKKEENMKREGGRKRTMCRYRHLVKKLDRASKRSEDRREREESLHQREQQQAQDETPTPALRTRMRFEARRERRRTRN